MLTRPIPSSGEHLAVIGLGTWATFDVGNDATKQRECADVLRALLDGGGAMVDSSPMYGSAQAVIGRALKTLGNPATVFSADKVWTSERDGRAQLEQTMRLWGLDRLDLVAVHNLVRVEDHLPLLFDLKAEGKIRYAGVTTYSGKLHDEVEQLMRTQPIDAVQLTYNVFDREAEKRLLPLAREKGIAIIANRPFREGKLLRELTAKPLPAVARDVGAQSWPQLLLKFVISHPAITCVIPATRSVAHMRDDLAAASGVIPDDAMRERIAREIARL